MTPPKSQLAFQLKTLFMGSDGTIPESYSRRMIVRGWRSSACRAAEAEPVPGPTESRP